MTLGRRMPALAPLKRVRGSMSKQCAELSIPDMAANVGTVTFVFLWLEVMFGSKICYIWGLDWNKLYCSAEEPLSAFLKPLSVMHMHRRWFMKEGELQ